MKVTRILAVVALLVLAAGAVQAQEITRLSWGTCDPWVVNQNFAGPINYKVVMSVIGASGLYSGHDTTVEIRPNIPIPDCWIFTTQGCQAQSPTYVTTGLSKSCPAFEGVGPFAITNFGYDPLINPYVQIRLANTFSAFNAVATTRYTMWQITFFQQYSARGPSTPDSCGGAEIAENLASTGTEFLHTDGHVTEQTSPEQYVTWNGGVLPVPAQASTWGRVKGLYR